MEEFKNTRKFLRSTRPSKFGTQIQVTRPDGTRVMLTNLYQKNFDVTNLGRHQRAKHARAVRTDNENIIEAQKSLIQIDSLEQTDRDLLETVKAYLVDILDNTYNSLVNEICNQIVNSQGAGQVEDKLHFFKLSAFMIQIQRFKAYE